LRGVEGFDIYDPVRVADICLVPNVIVPKKFRVPNCNIPHSGIKTTISCQPKNIVINLLYICMYVCMYVCIHGFCIKIYRNFDGVPPIPEGPKLLTYNLFTLLITRITSLNPNPIILGFNSTNILTPINHNIYDIHYITKYHYGWIKKI
jgi:hypothetical protein